VYAAASVAVAGVAVATVDGYGTGPAVGMVLVGASLLLRRSSVGLTAVVFVSAVWVNGWLFGTQVRCLAEFSAAAYIVFWAGRTFAPRTTLRWCWLVPVFLVGEHRFDPVMTWGGLVMAVPMLLISADLGRTVRGTEQRAARVADGLGLLRRQRAYTAQLAAAAERVRIHERLHAVVDSRLADIVRLGTGPGSGDPEPAGQVLANMHAIATDALKRVQSVLLDLKAPGSVDAPGWGATADCATDVRPPGRTRRLLTSSAVVTAVLGSLCLAELTDLLLNPRAEGSLTALPTVQRCSVSLATLALIGSVCLCRRRPVAAVLLQSTVGPALIIFGPEVDYLPSTALLTLAAVAYSAGLRLGLRQSRAALALLLATWLVAEFGFGAGVPVPIYPLVGCWVAARVIRSRRRVTAELQALHIDLAAERDRQAGLAAEVERRHLLREIHDQIGGVLAAVMIMAVGARRVSAVEPGADRRAVGLITEEVRQKRQAIAGMREASGPIGPTASVSGVITWMRRVGQRVDVVGSVPDLPGELEHVLTRVVQESLANVLRHAPGAQATIELRAEGDELAVCVANGPGSPGTAPTSVGTHLGLDAMMSRVTAVGGTMTAGPAHPDASARAGWAVRARLPLTVRPDPAAELAATV
jgi:signal transduction histidine kinase